MPNDRPTLSRHKGLGLGEAGIHSEELFRSLMEQSPLAIELLTPDGQIDRVNAAWQQLWAFPDEELAQFLSEYNMLTDMQAEALGIASLIKRAFAGEPIILPPIQYDGTVAAEVVGLEGTQLRSPWIQCHLYPIKDADGKVTGVVNTYVDITDLRRAEQDARKQREALARVGRTTVMGQLTGSISHELNQPLTGILGNAQAAELLIRRDPCDLDEIAEILADIAADAMRAGEMIRNLRNIYREQRVDFSVVDINAVLEETTQLLRSEFVIQSVAFSIEYAPSNPIVHGNWVQLQQVLVNLIMNGMEAMQDAMPRSRQIRVVAALHANVVKVSVADDGDGIDEAIIEHIFEPLATWKSSGMGLGLSICNTIVEAHGGSMWAQNRPGGGAIVGFTLPILDGDAPA